MIYALLLTLLKRLRKEAVFGQTCPLIKIMLVHKALEEDQLGGQ
jgi:hypothetical protein